MNSALEVMKAIVENGGPIEAWVGNYKSEKLSKTIVIGISTIGNKIFESEFGEWYLYCSLTDPHKKETRPKTAPEFAQWAVGKRYAWMHKSWDDNSWRINMNFGMREKASNWLWTELDSTEFLAGNPVWHEVPEVEV